MRIFTIAIERPPRPQQQPPLLGVTPKERLEHLRQRQELEAERISYEELAELQSLVPYIEPGDVQLLEAAGVPEHPQCRVCGATVLSHEWRSHLETHNPAAHALDWEDVRGRFRDEEEETPPA